MAMAMSDLGSAAVQAWANREDAEHDAADEPTGHTGDQPAGQGAVAPCAVVAVVIGLPVV
jgi:hypothetical protein